MSLPGFWPWLLAAVAFVALRIAGYPGQKVASLAMKLVIGTAVLWGIDLIGGGAGIALGVNPVSAAAVGYLGVPGLLLVAGSHYILSGSLH